MSPWSLSPVRLPPGGVALVLCDKSCPPTCLTTHNPSPMPSLWVQKYFLFWPMLKLLFSKTPSCNPLKKTPQWRSSFQSPSPPFRERHLPAYHQGSQETLPPHFPPSPHLGLCFPRTMQVNRECSSMEHQQLLSPSLAKSCDTFPNFLEKTLALLVSFPIRSYSTE